MAILKAKGKRAELIKELSEYLKVFINDNEAWLELSNLYLQERDYAHAAFCMEELVLSNVSQISTLNMLICISAVKFNLS